MKTFNDLILEYKTKDDIKIYYGKTEIKPKKYIFDKESLDEFLTFYKNNKNLVNLDGIRLCHLNNNRWQVLKGVCNINEFNLQKFLTKFNKTYTYDELVILLENQEYILILL